MDAHRSDDAPDMPYAPAIPSNLLAALQAAGLSWPTDHTRQIHASQHCPELPASTAGIRPSILRRPAPPRIDEPIHVDHSPIGPTLLPHALPRAPVADGSSSSSNCRSTASRDSYPPGLAPAASTGLDPPISAVNLLAVSATRLGLSGSQSIPDLRRAEPFLATVTPPTSSPSHRGSSCTTPAGHLPSDGEQAHSLSPAEAGTVPPSPAASSAQIAPVGLPLVPPVMIGPSPAQIASVRRLSPPLQGLAGEVGDGQRSALLLTSQPLTSQPLVSL